MKKLLILIMGFFILALPLCAQAVSFELRSFEGAPSLVVVTIEELGGGGGFDFDLEVLPDPDTGNIGDLRGFWFNIDPYPFGLLSFDQATDPVAPFIDGDDVTSYLVSNDSVQNFGAQITPGGPFDVGVEFGEPGIGSDDILTTSFIVSNLSGTTFSNLSLNDFLTETDPSLNSLFAARLTSVGVFGSDDREGSSKLSAGGLTPIPEPSTMLLLASGLVGLAAVGRRKFFKKN